MAPFSERSLSALLSAVDVEAGEGEALLESRKIVEASARQVICTTPPGLASYLPKETNTMREVQVSPEWPHSQGALKLEMDGQISRGFWETVERPMGRSVLSTRVVI